MTKSSKEIFSYSFGAINLANFVSFLKLIFSVSLLIGSPKIFLNIKRTFFLACIRIVSSESLDDMWESSFLVLEEKYNHCAILPYKSPYQYFINIFWILCMFYFIIDIRIFLSSILLLFRNNTYFCYAILRLPLPALRQRLFGLPQKVSAFCSSCSNLSHSFRFKFRHSFMASWRRTILQNAWNAYSICPMNCSEYLIFFHPLSSQ